MFLTRDQIKFKRRYLEVYTELLNVLYKIDQATMDKDSKDFVLIEFEDLVEAGELGKIYKFIEGLEELGFTVTIKDIKPTIIQSINTDDITQVGATTTSYVLLISVF